MILWHEFTGAAGEGDLFACNHQAALASVSPLPDGKARVDFEVPQAAVTPGQVAVFYDPETGEEVLGGGWIEGGTPTP